jgi:hypothetical protein
MACGSIPAPTASILEMQNFLKSLAAKLDFVIEPAGAASITQRNQAIPRKKQKR